MMKWLFFFAILAICGGCPSLSTRLDLGQKPPEPQPLSDEPMLQLDVGMHTDEITKLATDPQNQYLVTGSLDKTVRIWKLSDEGKLWKTLRLPIGQGNEGKIYAVAIAPDARTVACAGWTGLAWESKASVYFFDVETGQLIRRITDLPNVVRHLSYNRFGDSLAIALGGNSGVRLYQIKDYSLVMWDKHYDGTAYMVDFDNKGRFAVTSEDGYIRLYNKKGELIATQKSQSGTRPYGVSFSPKKPYLAVGYADTVQIDIFSADDLSLIPDIHPRIENLPGADLRCVAWSGDGEFLYAAGKYYKQNINQVCIWPSYGRGSKQEVPVCQYAIHHILALQNQGIAFASADPSWGVVDEYSSLSIMYNAVGHDFRPNPEQFRVSAQGNVVQFPLEKEAKDVVQFSLESRAINFVPLTEIDKLNKAVFTLPGFDIRWNTPEYRTAPELNSIALAWNADESAVALACHSASQKFALGSDQKLRLFERSGKLLWATSTSSTVWCIALTEDQRWAVAGLGDGTIRWYRASDGQEMLCLFAAKDRKRWIIWHPDKETARAGYYDCSVNSEQLLGWHKNNSIMDAADFLPLYRYLYYPELLANIISTGEISQDLLAKSSAVPLEKALSPLVQIISPKENTPLLASQITVEFDIRSRAPREPISDFMVQVDGRQVAKERNIGRGSYRHQQRIAIPSRDCTVSVIARTKYAVSEPATVHIKWQGKEFLTKPKLYILAVGISKYADPGLKLRFAAKDAQDFAQILANQSELYDDTIVRLLLDEKADAKAIQDGLIWLRDNATVEDVVMVFLAGHGIKDELGNYYFLPVDANIDSISQTSVIFSKITDELIQLPCKTLFFLDTCHSGAVTGTKRSSLDINKMLLGLTSAENGLVVFASSTGNQVSYENPQWGNGAFTKALIEGLQGKADYSLKDLPSDSQVWVNELNLYLSQRVPELTSGSQTPSIGIPKTIKDFPIVNIKKEK